MDPEKKKTLHLIELIVRSLPLAVRGKHLVFLVKDYIEDYDNVYARSLIRQIDPIYFERYIYAQAAEDSMLRDAIAVIIDNFGLGWTMLAHPAGQA
jgi:hypothetical protein